MNNNRYSDDNKVHDVQRLKELQALSLERKVLITQSRILELWVYTTIPYKNNFEKWDSYDGNYLCVDNIISPNILNNLCSWEDEKPTSIAWLLGKKDENE